jgi:polyisoprenoid-binding protein YceI
MATTTWKIDPMHSEVQFKVKHLMITNVSGSFSKFDSTIETEDDDLTKAKISFEADINTISTNNEQRDGHLKSDDFFNAEKFPKLTFVSTSYKKISDDKATLEGHLTIRDNTKPVTLEVEPSGVVKDAYGQTKIGFEITGKINRKEFGLVWSAVTEAGGLVLSDDVKLSVNAQFIKQA